MTFEAGVSGNPKGRPKGAINRRSKAYLEEAERRGVAPLDVLIGVMEHFLRRARNARSAEKRDASMIEARDAAQMAAPYMHAKLRQLEVGTREPRVEDLSDEELVRKIQDGLTELGFPPEMVRAVPDRLIRRTVVPPTVPGVAVGPTQPCIDGHGGGTDAR